MPSANQRSVAWQIRPAADLMPLLARRYRYLRTLSESSLSQILCAVDTFCDHAGLVAIKVMNAQHWTLGAQEYERLRLLWRTLLHDDCRADIVRPRSCFEHGDHFCIVFDMLVGLEVQLFASTICIRLHLPHHSQLRDALGACSRRVCSRLSLQHGAWRFP